MLVRREQAAGLSRKVRGRSVGRIQLASVDWPAQEFKEHVGSKRMRLPVKHVFALLLLIILASCTNRSDEGERLLELIESIQQEAAVTLPEESNEERYQRIGDFLETMEPELSALIQDPSTWRGDCAQLSADVRGAWDRMTIFAIGGQSLATFRRDGGRAAAGIDRRSALLNEVLGCDMAAQ